jgi:hypothetical protein
MAEKTAVFSFTLHSLSARSTRARKMTTASCQKNDAPQIKNSKGCIELAWVYKCRSLARTTEMKMTEKLSFWPLAWRTIGPQQQVGDSPEVMAER